MAKKREDPVESTGWSEVRRTEVTQVIRVDGTENLEKRVENMTRHFYNEWTRREDKKQLFTSTVKNKGDYRGQELFEVRVNGSIYDFPLVMRSSTNSVDSAKSMGEHRVQKWIEQFPFIVDAPPSPPPVEEE